MIKNFHELKDYIADKTNEPALKYRPQGEGGNLFFRPVGLLPFISAICQIMVTEKNFDFKALLTNYALFLDRNVASEYWTRILWDASAKKMLVRNGGITKYLMVEMYSSNILTRKERDKMTERFVQLFSISNKNEAENLITQKYSNRMKNK